MSAKVISSCRPLMTKPISFLIDYLSSPGANLFVVDQRHGGYVKMSKSEVLDRLKNDGYRLRDLYIGGERERLSVSESYDDDERMDVHVETCGTIRLTDWAIEQDSYADFVNPFSDDDATAASEYAEVVDNKMMPTWWRGGEQRSMSPVFKSVIDGYVNLGSSEYAGQFWQCSERNKLPKLDVPGADLYILPNNDLMQIIEGKVWVHWCQDDEILREHHDREQISGYSYDPFVGDLIVQATEALALYSGVCHWFSPSDISDFKDSGYVDYNYYVKYGQYAHEKEAAFVAHVERCKKRNCNDPVMMKLLTDLESATEDGGFIKERRL